MSDSYLHKNAQQAKALISGVQKGDKEQFEQLYDNYAPLLHGAILRIVKKELLAASVLKDTFIKVRKDMIAGQCTEDNLCTWMLSVARKLSLEVRDRNESYPSSVDGTDTVLNMILQKGYTLQQTADELDITIEGVCKALRSELIRNWK